MKIFEIDEAIRSCVDEETGEVDIEKLEQLQAERDEKVEKIALWTLELASEEKIVNEQIQRLQKRKNAIENRRKSLREFLLQITGGQKFKTPLVTVSVRETSKLVVDNIDELPDEFVELTVKKTVNNAKLKEAFGEWQTIAGAHMETKKSLTVR